MIWGFALLGIGCGVLSIALFERLPAKWLCDFGESPSQQSGKRLPGKAVPLLAFNGAVLYSLLYLQYGLGIKLALFCMAAFPIFLCVLSDLKYQILPTQLCFAIALLALPMLFTEGLAGFIGMLTGGLLSGGIFYLLGLIGQLVYKKEALGFGDVYFAAALGLYFHTFESLWIFGLAILTAAVTFSVLAIGGRLQAGRYVPLGPFIGAGFYLAVSFLSQLRSLTLWYVSLINF